MAEPQTPTVADLVTAVSFGLGLWWATGGPAWAGLASIVGDEVDGRLARAMGQTSERGSALDWGADVALTSASLVRLGRELDHPALALPAAPLVLYGQAQLRSEGWRPTVGSARAIIMLATMAIVAHHDAKRTRKRRKR